MFPNSGYVSAYAKPHHIRSMNGENRRLHSSARGKAMMSAMEIFRQPYENPTHVACHVGAFMGLLPPFHLDCHSLAVVYPHTSEAVHPRASRTIASVFFYLAAALR